MNAALNYQSHNTTQIAIEQANLPSFEEAFFGMLGVVDQRLIGTLDPNAPPMMQQFLSKIVMIHPLPALSAISCLQGIIFWLTFLWFMINLFSMGMWVFAPQWFTKVLSSSSSSSSSSATASAKSAAETTTQSATAVNTGESKKDS